MKTWTMTLQFEVAGKTAKGKEEAKRPPNKVTFTDSLIC
jgi:hypothetical protein